MKTLKSLLISNNITKREKTFIKVKNLIHFGSHNHRIKGAYLFLDLFNKFSFEVTI